MFTDYLLSVFENNKAKDAIVWEDRTYSYEWLIKAYFTWKDFLETQGIPVASVVSVEADFSPNSVALLIALIERACIVVPLTKSVEVKKPSFREISEVEYIIRVDEKDDGSTQATSHIPKNSLLCSLKDKGHPGLVLYSSGSTGKNKAALHDLVPLLDKFMVPRHGKRTMAFLLFDHIGGFNTLLYTLSNAGCVITVRNRHPDFICSIIEKHKVEILPTSPTFINLLLLSESYKSYDLSSLELVTYGTEVMAENTLKRFHSLFPAVRLLQTYGLSELGILRSKSKSSDSLWAKVGGEGFETRVKDGMLEIKAKSAMLGYLNEKSPFSKDGWFITGDMVEVDGEYIKILGRKSEIINVGGEKVYPVEVENVLMSMDGVEDVSISGETNSIMGNIVVARVKLTTDEGVVDFRKRMRTFCKERMASFKIPQKIVLVNALMHGERFKKLRN